MPVRHVIVDGSNLATEGRSLPSLSQLDQAVREFLAENPGDVVTVVVDASFGHRIDPSELPMFEDAEAAGEVVSPPAGAIGRGDAFLLRIAEKTGATVLSNDSFQEFHGEHVWLFDDGRLIGGKPVPGVGWIFMPRTPVRGQKSREVVKEAKRKKRAEEAVHGAVAVAAGTGSGLDLAASRSKGRGKKVDRAIARATEEAVEPKTDGGRRRRASGVPPADPVNEPLAFITFIAAHPLGSEVVGTVAEFSSHGAFVDADGARCYLPLSAMGDPPPRRARQVVGKAEERTFVVQALDPQRRGVELALPGFARVAGGPTEETVEAEIHPQIAPPKRRRGVKAPVVAAGVEAEAEATDGKPATAPAAKETRGRGGKQATARGAGPAKKAAGPKKAAEPAKKAAGAAKKTAGAAKKAAEPAKKTAGDAKKAAAPAKKAAEPAKKAGASTRKAGGPTEQAASAKRAAGAKKAATAEMTEPAKKSVAKKAGTKKAGVGAPRGRAAANETQRATSAAAPSEKVAAVRSPRT